MRMGEISKTRLVELADIKLADAKLLLASGRGENAYYLAGYAVELMLKAILSTQFKDDTLPDRALVRDAFVHDIEKLARSSKIDGDLKFWLDNDERFNASWKTVLEWDPISRYDPRSIDDAAGLVRAIDDAEHGVMKWLRGHL